MEYARLTQRHAGCAVLALCLLICHTSTFAQTDGASSADWQLFEAAIARAEATDRYVFVHVYAPWCGWCLKMEQEVYPDPRVKSYLMSHFVRARLNYDDAETMYTYAGRTLNARELAHEFNVDGVPAVVILNPEGEYLLHLSGFQEADRLLSVLRYIGSESYSTESFSTFVKDQ